MPKTQSKRRLHRSNDGIKQRSAKSLEDDDVKNKILSAIFLTGDNGAKVDDIATMLSVDLEEDGVTETLELLLKQMQTEGLVEGGAKGYILEEKGFQRIERLPD